MLLSDRFAWSTSNFGVALFAALLSAAYCPSAAFPSVSTSTWKLVALFGAALAPAGSTSAAPASNRQTTRVADRIIPSLDVRETGLLETQSLASGREPRAPHRGPRVLSSSPRVPGNGGGTTRADERPAPTG